MNTRWIVPFLFNFGRWKNGEITITFLNNSTISKQPKSVLI